MDSNNSTYEELIQNNGMYEKLIQKAEKYWHERKYQLASDCATQAILSDKTRPDAYYWRGRSHERLHKVKKIQGDAFVLLTCIPFSALHYAYRGWAYCVIGEPEKAVVECTEALRRDKDEIEAYHYKAWALLSLCKYKDVIINCDEIVPEGTPAAYENSPFYNSRGLAYLDMGIVYREKEISFNTEYFTLKHQRDALQTRNDELLGKNIEWKKLNDALLTRNDELLGKNIEWKKLNDELQTRNDESMKQNVKKIVYFEKMMKDSKKTSERYKKQKKDYFGKAEENFNLATECNPNYSYAYCNLGELYYLDNNIQKAIENFGKAIECDKEYDLAYCGRGKSRLASREVIPEDDYNKSEKDYQKAIELGPEYADAYYNLGMLYKCKDCEEKALKNFELAVQYVPKTDKKRRTEHEARLAGCYVQRSSKKRSEKKIDDEIKDCAEAVRLCPSVDTYISGFLDAVLVWCNEIGQDAREKLKESPHGLVSLVGKILDTFKNERSNKGREITRLYIELIQNVHCLLVELGKAKNKLREEKPRKLFYQYRKTKGSLEAMRKKGVFLLRPTSYANDPDEGKHVFKFFESNIDEDKRSKDKPSELKTLLSDLSKHENTDLGLPIAFIRSFSTPRDDLQMWNSSYAGNGEGYSIGCPLSKFRTTKVYEDTASKQSAEDDTGNFSIKQQIFRVSSTDDSNEVRKKPKKIPIDRLSFTEVIYLTLTFDEDTKYKKQLQKIKETLEKFPETYLKDENNKKNFKKFLPQIFLPIAHLIKSADYQHEQEWRLLYCTSVKNDRKNDHYISDEPIGDKDAPSLHIETEEILFNDSDNKEEILLGPIFDQHLEKERLRIQHLFEYDGKDDCVVINKSEKHFR